MHEPLWYEAFSRRFLMENWVSAYSSMSILIHLLHLYEKNYIITKVT
jgi:hypothetical protein